MGEGKATTSKKDGSKLFLSFSHIVHEVFKAEGDISFKRRKRRVAGTDKAGTEDMGRLWSRFQTGKL